MQYSKIETPKMLQDGWRTLEEDVLMILNKEKANPTEEKKKNFYQNSKK